MLVALITDIHGNREALAACLDHARRSGVGRYVFLGDYIGYGADPGWVLDTVMAHVGAGAIALRGNHDEAVFGRDEVMNHLAREAIRWTAEHLSSGQRDFLARLPLAVHGTRPRAHQLGQKPFTTLLSTPVGATRRPNPL